MFKCRPSLGLVDTILNLFCLGKWTYLKSGVWPFASWPTTEDEERVREVGPWNEEPLKESNIEFYCYSNCLKLWWLVVELQEEEFYSIGLLLLIQIVLGLCNCYVYLKVDNVM